MNNIKLVRALASAVLALAIGGCGFVAQGAQIVATEVAAVYSPPTATARPTRAPATLVAPAATRSPSGTPAPTPTPRSTARPTATPAGATPEPRPSAKDTELQIRVFGELWKTVKDNYIYEDFNGVDWAALKPETDAKIRAGLTNTEFFMLMGEIVEGLNDDHSRYQSPIEVKECALTLRWSRLAPAWHLARFLAWYIIRLAGQAPVRFRPLSSNARLHSPSPCPSGPFLKCFALWFTAEPSKATLVPPR